MYDPISLILSILGVSSLILYFIRWKFYQPDLFFRVGGEQQGKSIKVNPTGHIPFATFTNSKKKIKILELSLLFDPDEVDLFKTQGIEKSLTSDRLFPASIQFGDKKDVVRGFLQANFFNYEAKGDKFTIKFEVLSEIDPPEIPPLLDMIPSRKVRSSRTVTFEVDKNIVWNHITHGLLCKAGEAMQTVGVQAQNGVSAQTEHGEGKLKVLQLIDDNK